MPKQGFIDWPKFERLMNNSKEEGFRFRAEVAGQFKDVDPESDGAARSYYQLYLATCKTQNIITAKEYDEIFQEFSNGAAAESEAQEAPVNAHKKAESKPKKKAAKAAKAAEPAKAEKSAAKPKKAAAKKTGPVIIKQEGESGMAARYRVTGNPFGETTAGYLIFKILKKGATREDIHTKVLEAYPKTSAVTINAYIYRLGSHFRLTQGLPLTIKYVEKSQRFTVIPYVED